MDIWKENLEKEIVLSQNGRYLEFYKRGSPLIFKYDMASHNLSCIKRSTNEIKHYPRSKINRWFNCKITTEDSKLGYMFKYAASLAEDSNDASSFYDIMNTYFGSPKVAKLEQWAAIGTQFRMRSHVWGSSRTAQEIRNRPNDVSREIRDYISSKTWTISELNRFTSTIKSLYMRNVRHIDQVFAVLTDHPEYGDAFTTIHNGQVENYLTSLEILNEIDQLIERFNLQVERLMFYFNYLNNVEGIDVKTLMESYGNYLECELQHQNGRRNRMYKFPCYFMTTYHKQQSEIRRTMELEHYTPTDDDHEFAYLEYSDDEYCIIIPRSPDDVRSEGRQQHHCVASHFMQYIADGDTMVVFMRRTSDPDTSLVTIEIRNNRIRQACVAHNGRVPEGLRDWIRHWAAIKGIGVDNASWSTSLAFRD